MKIYQIQIACVFFFFGYSFLFCRSTKKKKVTREIKNLEEIILQKETY